MVLGILRAEEKEQEREIESERAGHGERRIFLRK
jgi:hypothetical protein